MESKKNPSADIHEKRGLYMAAALAITLLIANLFFSWQFETSGNRLRERITDTPMEPIIDVPITEQKPPEAPVVQKPKSTIVTEAEVIEIAEKVTVETKEPATEQKSVATEVVADEPEDSEEIFTFVESPPQFPGGDEAILKFVKQELKYPKIAKKLRVQGKVFVGATIEKDGSLSGIHIVQGIGGGCDEEAERVIQALPHWIPGKQRGKPVRVSMTIPITFKLN